MKNKRSIHIKIDPDLWRVIEVYALNHKLTKTDAYRFFLQRGLGTVDLRD